MIGEPTENNGKRRDRHDIFAEILKTAREGRIKTHIMYKAKLSYAQTNAYLNLLRGKGFLETSTVIRDKQEREIYTTTSRGNAFLEGIDTVNEMLQ